MKRIILLLGVILLSFTGCFIGAPSTDPVDVPGSADYSWEEVRASFISDLIDVLYTISGGTAAEYNLAASVWEERAAPAALQAMFAGIGLLCCILRRLQCARLQQRACRVCCFQRSPHEQHDAFLSRLANCFSP